MEMSPWQTVPWNGTHISHEVNVSVSNIFLELFLKPFHKPIKIILKIIIEIIFPFIFGKIIEVNDFYELVFPLVFAVVVFTFIFISLLSLPFFLFCRYLSRPFCLLVLSPVLSDDGHRRLRILILLHRRSIGPTQPRHRKSQG